MAGEERDQHEPECDAGERAPAAEAAGRPRLGHAVDEERDARREQGQALQVERAAEPRRDLGQEAQGEQDGDQPDRQVDEEDPAPADLVDDRAADHRPEDRCEQHRHADHAHHAPHALRSGRLGEDRLADRHQQAASDALEHAEADQRLDRPGRSRQR